MNKDICFYVEKAPLFPKMGEIRICRQCYDAQLMDSRKRNREGRRHARRIIVGP